MKFYNPFELGMKSCIASRPGTITLSGSNYPSLIINCYGLKVFRAIEVLLYYTEGLAMEIIEHFSCSTKLSKKFILLINV